MHFSDIAICSIGGIMSTESKGETKQTGSDRPRPMKAAETTKIDCRSGPGKTEGKCSRIGRVP